MTFKRRLEKLERGFRTLAGLCPDHWHTVIIMVGEPMPEESTIPLCRNCGRPGSVLVIEEVVINSGADLKMAGLP